MFLPRVIPVIIAPFGVGAAVQLHIWIFLMIFSPLQATDDAYQSCRDIGAVQTTSKIPHISRVVSIANTAAMSFLTR